MKEKQNFEEMLDSLEEIVQSLEKDDLKLSLSVHLSFVLQFFNIKNNDCVLRR